jgi:hypothetical protein
MKTLLSAIALILVVTASSYAQAIDGDWNGTLDAGGQQLRLVLHLTPDGKGGFAGSLDSLDQGAKGISVTAVTVVDSVLKFELPQIGGSYEGKIDAGGSSVDGTWSQGGISLPLVWKRQQPVA